MKKTEIMLADIKLMRIFAALKGVLVETGMPVGNRMN
jgi:hypothetical protein